MGTRLQETNVLADVRYSSLRVWSVVSCDEVASLPHPCYVYATRFVPTPPLTPHPPPSTPPSSHHYTLFTGAYDKIVRVWTLNPSRVQVISLLHCTQPFVPGGKSYSMMHIHVHVYISVVASLLKCFTIKCCNTRAEVHVYMTHVWTDNIVSHAVLMITVNSGA